MKRFVLTGAPGSGKTTVLRALAALGYETVADRTARIDAHIRASTQAAPTGPA